MQPNRLLKKLGFAENDRLVILHADDIGMCQASVAAFAELDAFGLISSGSVMAPCPWFLAAADYARQHPRSDLGVHLTLTSEWSLYRWRPLSTVDPASGLLDEEGYFPRQTAQVREQADPQAVAIELEAQIERALRAGMQPTHFDTHMGAVASLKFIPAYLQLVLKYRIPAMIFRFEEGGWRERGLDGESAALAVRMVDQLEEMGLPLLDHLSGLHLEDPRDRLGQMCQAIDALQPGITHFIVHPAKDTPELRAITSDWPCRAADYALFLNEALCEHLRQAGAQVLGYRALRDLMGKEV